MENGLEMIVELVHVKMTVTMLVGVIMEIVNAFLVLNWGKTVNAQY